MLNLLALAAIGVAAFCVTFVVAILSSERVRKHGVFGAISQEVSSASRLRNPYRS